MNVELLKEFCEKIIEYETEYGVQAILEALRSSMESLASNPQDQTQQKNVATSLKKLQDAISLFEQQFSPKEQERLYEIRAYKYFSKQFVSEINKEILENSLSPAVVRDHINAATKKRQQYIDNLKSLVSSLDKIGIEIEYIDDSDTEIGFQIPRDIFNNNLEGLIVEFNAIKNIVRTFSEVTTGSVEEIKVGQISTSDPLIFLAQAAPVVLALAKTVDWCLAKWKEVEEIRNLRAQTAQIEHFTKKDIKMFDDKINAVIEQGIEEKVKELLKDSSLDKTRKNEMDKALTHALESLFARIERGMTIELRMVAYYEDEPDSENEDAQTDDKKSPHNTLNKTLEELGAIQAQLKFPSPSPDPVLKIPQSQKNDVLQSGDKDEKKS